MEGLSVAIIGSGSVATNLAFSLNRVVNIKQVWSRNVENAMALASKLGLSNHSAIDSFSSLDRNLDIYIISVPDSAYRNIYNSFPLVKGIVVNTSGALGIPDIPGCRCGVFYPLQTFRKEKIADFRRIPILIEGRDNETVTALVRLAEKISDKVKVINDNGIKAKLHLAAVFASNFSNYLWSLSESILNECGEDLSFLEPLVCENLSNAIALGADAAQTGPAMRGDRNVLERHLEIIGQSGLPSPEARQVYKLLSDNISKKYNPEK